MTLQLCTTDSGPQSQFGMVLGQVRIKVWAFRSQPAPLPVMPANAFILATKAMPASLNGERSRAFCFPHLLNLLESCSMCSPNHDGPDWFRHWLRFLPLPSIRNNALNPVLISGWLDCEAELIFECHPEQDPDRSRSVLNTCH